MSSARPPSCFVLMPFTVREQDLSRYQEADHWTQVFEGLVVPAIREAGLTCERDDVDLGSRIIADNIFAKIERADLILCDLSSHNPNVFLELGWALRADRPYVLVKDDLTKYAFDLNQQYTFTYSHRLQPIQLACEVKQLADIVRRTCGDHQRRYSIVGRLSFAFATIEAAKSGDVQAEMLLDIQRSIADLRGSATVRARENFPWPALLERGSRLLSAVLTFLDESTRDWSDADRLGRECGRIAKQFGVGGAEEIQFSVVDLTGRILYHDWPSMVGGNLVELSPFRAFLMRVSKDHLAFSRGPMELAISGTAFPTMVGAEAWASSQNRKTLGWLWLWKYTLGSNEVLETGIFRLRLCGRYRVFGAWGNTFVSSLSESRGVFPCYSRETYTARVYNVTLSSAQNGALESEGVK